MSNAGRWAGVSNVEQCGHMTYLNFGEGRAQHGLLLLEVVEPPTVQVGLPWLLRREPLRGEPLRREPLGHVLMGRVPLRRAQA